MSENFQWREQVKPNFKINVYVLDFMGKSEGRYAGSNVPDFWRCVNLCLLHLVIAREMHVLD